MRKLIVLFALLFTLPMFGDDNPQPVTAEQYGSVRVADPIDEWMYWQEHYDVLERAAKEDEARPKHHGIAAEIEGCKYCQKMELYSPVYCNTWTPPGLPTSTNCYATDPGNWCSQQPDCSEWVSWVPKEVGNKCTTIGATTTLSAMLTADHQASSSMTMWLNQRLSLSPEQIAYGFSPYTWNIEGGSSCAGASSTTQTWTTPVGGGQSWSSQVKIWSCSGASGSACSVDSQVQP